MPTIGWNENSPADSDNAGLGDDEIRSLKTNLRGGLDGEHNFPSTGGANVGYHRYGSARPYFGPISQCSSDGTDARLFTTSNTSEVYSLSSLGAWPVGGQYALLSGLSAGVYTPTTTSKNKLSVQFGQDNVNTSTGTAIVTFAGSGYSGKPVIFVSPTETGLVFSNAVVASVFAKSATTFGVIMSWNTAGTGGGPASFGTGTIGWAFNWMSIGTVASGVP
jgi:hypothetical protein